MFIGEAMAVLNRRKQILERKAAMFGINTPPEVTMEIADIQHVLTGMKAIYAAFEAGEDVDNRVARLIGFIADHDMGISSLEMKQEDYGGIF